MNSGQRLLLIGGGHAQLFVLEALAKRKIVADDITLVSSQSTQLYSGMVPGLIEGRYTLGQLTFDLGALARAAGARFIEDSVTRIDAQAKLVTLASGESLEYEVASIALGGAPGSAMIPGVAAHACFVKPAERAGALIPRMETAARSAGPEPLQVVVVGAGAAGIEIALTTRARLDQAGAQRAIITLVDSSSALLRQTGQAAADAAETALRRGEITIRLSTGVEEVGSDHVRVSGGRIIPSDLTIWCAGVDAPPLLRHSGLPVEARGYLTVHDTLAVPGTTGLFGAGDAVSLQYAPRLPKSGVTAVRMGPILAHNIGVALGSGGGNPIPYRPTLRALQLLNTGDGGAILCYSGLVGSGRWAMLLKDFIDRRFVRRFKQLEAGTPAGGPP